MVLLYQSPSGGPHGNIHNIVLQRLKSHSDKTRAWENEQSQKNGPVGDSCFHTSYHINFAHHAMGRDEVRMDRSPNHCSLRDIRGIWNRLVCDSILEARRSHGPSSFAQESQCSWRRHPRDVSGRFFFCFWILRELLCRKPMFGQTSNKPSFPFGSKQLKENQHQNPESITSPWWFL